MTINLNPDDNDKDSLLRRLDWENDDYTMELVSSRLHDKSLDEVLSKLALLNDRGGEIIFFPSLAEAGENSIKVALPPKILFMVEQISTKFHDLELSDATRVAAVHGLSIYYNSIGCEIEKILKDSIDCQVSGNNESILKCLLPSNVDFKHTKYSCKINGKLFQSLAKLSAHAGCHKQHMIGIWVLYAVRTHPKFILQKDAINHILDEFELSMKLRIKILKQE